MWKLKSWNLEIKFGNWNFEKLFKIEKFKNYLKIGVVKIIQNLKLWKLFEKKWNFEN